ncbi:MAG: ribosomal-protein-alanine N-acetyltransferase [Streptosporangiales bacterium]|nr:ribosomal-protein-alanine N-acetyltransferase [Streptosporangiales bacterium]
MTARLRAMTYADLPEVMTIERRLFPEDAWSERMFRQELGAPGRYYLVVESDGRVVGYAGLMAAGDQSDVQTIAVLPEEQGKGYGRSLLEELLAEALRRGAYETFLEVRADNPRAQELYRRRGFVRVGVRPGYYNGHDALVMAYNARNHPTTAPDAEAQGAGPRGAEARGDSDEGGDGRGR